MSKRNFFRSEDGTIAIETVVIIPLLIWAYLAMFTIFDTYRQYTTQQKAAYTISDLISRQATPLDAAFVDGLYQLYNHLARTRTGAGMRVTLATYDLNNQEYEVIWSRTRGTMIALQSGDVADWSNRLPVMANDDQIIIVETTSPFQPVFNIGLDAQTINNFVFTRPRYAKQLCFGDVCGNTGANTGGEQSPDEQA